jgi:ADP-heptose:LPS heptosyltransferase
MLWILQDKSFALGNFINITPVIKFLYDKTKEKIPVYFETGYVKECYKESPYIEHLKFKPINTPFVSSSLINQKKPDYIYSFEVATQQIYSDLYKPFIDIIDLKIENYILIMNGSGSINSKYVELKNPGEKIYEHMISRLKYLGHRIIFTGNKDDLERVRKVQHLFDELVINDIRLSLKCVQKAKYIITNDTGLAHVAGCFNKPQLVLWKDTNFIKNINSGNQSVYAQKDEWFNVFDSVKHKIPKNA